MQRNEITSKSVFNNFFLVITSACTILSFLYIVLGDPELTKWVAYFFAFSFALFLVLVVMLLGRLVFRLEPKARDGRYFLQIVPLVLSLAGIFLYFRKPSSGQDWGLIFIILSLSISAIVIILALFVWVNKSYSCCEDKTYVVNSISAKLTRLGDHQYEYVIYKNIQSRVSILNSLDVRFKWSGDKVDSSKIKVESATHNIEGLEVDEDGYDSVKLNFKEPVFYKQSGTFHLKLSNLTDFDSPAGQYISFTVNSTESIELLSFNSVLKDVDPGYNKEALLQRRRVLAPSGAKFKTLLKVHFDSSSKSYYYDLPKPQPGFEYRLFWGD